MKTKIETALWVAENEHGVMLRHAETAATVWPGYHASAPLGTPGYWVGTGRRQVWVADTLPEALAVWADTYRTDELA